MGKTLRHIIKRREGYTTSSNQTLKGKTQDTIDAPIIEEIETAVKK
jgi:hypothetical protein